jgi:NhaA family Na+:H+ antiporter
LGVLSLLGKRVPVQLKIFLCALAIIDDLGAVITIGIFYTSALNLIYLLSGLAILGGVIFMNRRKVTNPLYYIVPAILLWYCLYNSGVHATLAGVMMAFSMPLKSMGRVEHLLHKPVNFLIMPLFALANTAIGLPSDFGHAYASTISLGIMAGLVVGKPIGIFLFAFIATKLKIASLPSHTSYKQLLGMGILGGIGFTMSIFTSTLAYPQEALQVMSKVSIISASVIAAISGYFYCTRLKPVSKAITTTHTSKAVSKQEEKVEQPLGVPDLVFG